VYSLRSDEEQRAALRQFWHQYGLIVVAAAVLVAAVCAGLWAWHSYQRNQAEEASAFYQKLLDESLLLSGNEQAPTDEKKAALEALWLPLKEEYGGTIYAQLAALVLAGKAVQTADLVAAKEKLEWVLERKPGNAIDTVTRLRLARVLLSLPADERHENATRALELLQAADAPGALSSAVEQVRGDILVALGKEDEAYAAYQNAAANALSGSWSSTLVTMKRDDLSPAEDSP